MAAGSRERLVQAFDSNWVAPVGPDLDAFEAEFAAYLGVKHAVALASCTAALHLALRFAGVTDGQPVFVSDLTFVAPANAIRYVGGQPVFIDSERSTWNMDAELLRAAVQRAIERNQQPKAVIAVDIFGQSADMQPIRQVCEEFGMFLIEDAAEALGATYHGQPAGTLGDIGCFSFNGNKMLTTSSGGMLVTNDAQCAAKVRHWATQARDPAVHYEHSELGHNYRMSNLLAAVGRGQLEVLNEHVSTRRKIHRAYREALEDLKGIEFIPNKRDESSCWLTCVLIDEAVLGVSREEIRLELEQQNIESRPCWKPMHLQPCFADAPMIGGAVAEQIFQQGLCLPSGSGMNDHDVSRVVSIIRAMVSGVAINV